ncbi:MAG TPA: tetratricopeptide repeat protein [Chitinophagaceae bacterium]|nr:tetratricopeptide repeat protein [Chitinophagaceae bacterium]
MKKTTIYIFIFLLFVAASVLIVFKYKAEEKRKESRLYEIIPRKGNAMQSSEWQLEKKLATQLIAKIKQNRSDIKSLNALTTVYLQEARCSGNFSYYDKAAINCVNAVLKMDRKNFEALTYRTTVYLSQHHFAEALKVAEQLQKMYPYSASVYGLLVDANVELGNYKIAVEDADKMVSIRPDIRSYSRISYLREIYGDISGAIDAMKFAVDAGSPGTETTEWARVQLGKLYEQIGEVRYAEMHYTIALQNRPDYPHALAGLARIAIAGKDYHKGIEMYLRADSLSNDYAFREALVEAYELAGDNHVSTSVAKGIIDQMEEASIAMAKGDSSGHYADKEMAYAYLAVNNYSKALEHALLEYNRRPDNIDANETLAWVYYNKGDYKKAAMYIKRSLRTNCKNPALLCRAGLIYAKAGDKTSAQNLLQPGLKNNPNISPMLKMQVQETLQSL